VKSKICTRCNIDKQLSEFYIKANGKLHAECKKCFNNRSVQYYLNHRQQCIKQSFRYYRNNKDKCDQVRAKWRLNHILADNLRHLQYRHAHKEMANLRSYISIYKKKLKNVKIIFKKLPYGKLTIKILRQRLKLLQSMNKKRE